LQKPAPLLKIYIKRKVNKKVQALEWGMILSESGRHHFSKHFTRNHPPQGKWNARKKKVNERNSFLKVNETARKRKMSKMILLIASFRIVSFFIRRAAMKGEKGASHKSKHFMEAAIYPRSFF